MLKSQEMRKLAPEMDPLRIGTGWKKEDLEKPQIMVESTYGDSHPGSGHLNLLVEEVRKGVAEAGGFGARYFCTDICDGESQGTDGINYSLASREMIANMIEIHANATPFDGGVYLSSCDKGMPGNRYMTTQITEMLTRLQVMTGGKLNQALSAMYQKALNYLTVQAGKEYKAMKEAEKKGVTNVSPSEQTLQFLYICALNGKAGANADMNRYFISKLSAQATDLTVYGKALSAIVLQQAGETVKAKEFVQSVMEYSVMTDKMGRYFDTPKAHYSWFGYKIPTEVAAMEAVQYVTKDEQALSQMKRWLLKEKQTQVWDTPVATVNAVYALLNSGTDLLANSDAVKITLGKEVIQTSAEEPVGYLKKVVEGNVLNLKKVTVDCEGSGMGWGAVYAQYLENMDKMGEQSSGLSVSRSLYKGETLIEEGTVLNIGDKITVRLTVKADRDMDFVQIKDERAACMEPLAALSGYRLSTNLGYYQATKDASTSFFVNQMRKGMYVIEYQVYVTRSGEYRSGIATIQSAYAPEFGGHTGGYKVVVK